MIKMYGIPNCDTVKKARHYLEDKGIAYEFIDFKRTPPTETDLLRWKTSFGGWPLNKNGPTFRKVKDEFEELSDDEVPEFVIANTSMIKRPILEQNGQVLAIGFDEVAYAKVV